MDQYPRFRIEIATIYGGAVFFNIYDSLDFFKIVGFAAYHFEKKVITTNVRCTTSAMHELQQQVKETAQSIMRAID